MKLFAIRNSVTNRIIPNTYFADKALAKKARDALTAQTQQDHKLTYGPDHRKFKA